MGREMRAHSGSIMLVNEETGELEYEIDERKRVEATLREKQELLSNILAGSAVGIGVVEDRKLSWTNESMMKMFGVENEEDYIGQSAKILYASEEEYERVGQILYKNRTDNVVQFDAELKRKDGGTNSVSCKDRGQNFGVMLDPRHHGAQAG
ncbi:MAG: PAS domain-containing protein [Euryarchaeota archaeon]|nr:PAS domain-containing protein [Euryarchaeota archaeon]